MSTVWLCCQCHPFYWWYTVSGVKQHVFIMSNKLYVCMVIHLILSLHLKENLHTCLCVCVWHMLLRLAGLSVCGEVVCISRIKSVSVSIVGRQAEYCVGLVWALHRKHMLLEDTWYLFPLQMFKRKNKHLSGKAGDFSPLASMTSNRASGAHCSAELTF